MEFKVGDVVQVIEENLGCKESVEYKTAKTFIEQNEDVFLVVNINEIYDYPIRISTENGQKLSFKECELRKVEY